MIGGQSKMGPTSSPDWEVHNDRWVIGGQSKISPTSSPDWEVDNDSWVIRWSE